MRKFTVIIILFVVSIFILSGCGWFSDDKEENVVNNIVGPGPLPDDDVPFDVDLCLPDTLGICEGVGEFRIISKTPFQIHAGINSVSFTLDVLEESLQLTILELLKQSQFLDPNQDVVTDIYFKVNIDNIRNGFFRGQLLEIRKR